MNDKREARLELKLVLGEIDNIASQLINYAGQIEEIVGHSELTNDDLYKMYPNIQQTLDSLYHKDVKNALHAADKLLVSAISRLRDKGIAVPNRPKLKVLQPTE